MMLARRLLLLAVACALVAPPGGGCASTTAPASNVSGEFTPQDAVLFDHGVDFIPSPLALEGHWRDEWIAELRGRVARADLIVAVAVRGLRTDVSPRGRDTYRLLVEVVDTLKGDPGQDELTLATTPEHPGYRTVDAHTEAVQSREFLVFGRWADAEGGGETLHWHLTPASDDVRAAVKKQLKEPSSGGSTTRTVTVHEPAE